jgi:hypothetical protein
MASHQELGWAVCGCHVNNGHNDNNSLRWRVPSFARLSVPVNVINVTVPARKMTIVKKNKKKAKFYTDAYQCCMLADGMLSTCEKVSSSM